MLEIIVKNNDKLIISCHFIVLKYIFCLKWIKREKMYRISGERGRLANKKNSLINYNVE